MMYRLFVALVVLLGVLSVEGTTLEECVLGCSPQLEACSEDATCINAMQCIAKCDPAKPRCAESCVGKPDELFTNFTTCATGCVPPGVSDVDALYVLAPFGAQIMPQMTNGHCSFMKKAICATAIASAIVACGGPEDIPCIVAALSALDGCVVCFCDSKGCPGLCKHFC